MQTRFYAEFTTREGNTFSVNILDDDFTGTAAESSVAPPGFELEYFGGQDVYSPLMPSTCRVPWIIQTTAEETFLAELADFQEGRFLIEIVEDPDGTAQRHWIGVMSPESIEIPDAALPYTIGLEAVCGLALLSRKQYDTSQQFSGALENSTLDHILNALRAIPGSTTDIFPLSSTMLVTVTDVRPDTGTSTDNFMQHVFFQAATNDILQGQNTVGTYEDMLVQICIMMNARLYQREGVWMLQSITRSMTAVNLITDVRAFDRAGSTTSTANISNFRKAINQTTRHRTNGTFSFLPTIRKVSRTIDFFGNAPFAGDSQILLSYFANDGNTASPYNIGLSITGTADVTLPTTQTVRATGSCLITVPWFDGDVNGVYQPLERVQRFRVRLKVRVGTKYLRRTAPYDFTYTTIEPDELYLPPGESSSDVEIFNPAAYGAFQWTTDSAARVDFWTELVVTGAADFIGIPRRTGVQWDFESPEIGSAESADVEVAVTFAGYHGEADAQNPDAFVSQSVKVAGCFAKGDFNLYLGDGSASADSITYAAELDNGATEEIAITPGLYGEVSSADIYIYNPAALLTNNFVSIPGFYSSVTSTTEPLAELICIDRLKHFGAVQRSWQGLIYSFDLLDPFNTFTFDSSVWMPVQMSYSAEQDAYEIECIEVDDLTSLDPDSVPQVRNVGTVQPPTGSINDVLQEQVNRGAREQADISETIADIETDVANINRTTGASGGESSVLLQYLGDVKISSPADGQLLQYNINAQRWANVSLPAGGSTYHGVGLDGNSTGVFIGTGTISFAVGDLVAHTAGTSKGIWACNSALTFNQQATETAATTEWLLVFNSFDHIGAPGDISLSDLQQSPSGSTFADSLNSFGITASSSISFSALATLVSGQLTHIGNYNSTGTVTGANLTTAGTLTASGLTYPTSDGTSGQVITTDGNGALSFTTVSGGGGGGGYSGPVPLAKISGRWQWSSSDDGERVMTGQTAYGPYNWYSHGNEPSNTTIRTYSASHVIDSTSGVMPAYYCFAFGVTVPTTDKKVRVDFAFRIQNAPANATFGHSLWGVGIPPQATTVAQTFTLRGVSPSVTVGTSTQAAYNGSYTTTSDINGGYVLPMFENRSGSLTTTVSMYGQISLYLVD